MEYIDKEVYFNVYCNMCINEKTPEAEEPCCSCLTQCSNEQSHVPTKFKPKDRGEYAKFMKTLKKVRDKGCCCCEQCEF